MAKYTVRDLNERATFKQIDQYGEIYHIDGHIISLKSVWSYGGGLDSSLVSVMVDGQMLATRCRRGTGLRKALASLEA